MRGLVLLLIWLAMPAWAERVVIRSGEHTGFTRLVIALPQGTGWRLEDTDVVFTRPVDLDTSDVFRLIPRTRLSGVVAERIGVPDAGGGTTRLRLSLACACVLAAREDRPGLLVIDIGDPRPAPPVILPRRIPHDLNVYWPPQVHTVNTLTDSALVGEVRGRLLQGFARAFAQGMIELEEPLAPSKPYRQDLPLPLRIQTALDREDTPIPEPRPPAACLPPAHIDIADWAKGADFSREIGSLRAPLLGEFDRPDPLAIRRLVQFYLHFGFGEEAAALLRIYPVEDGAELTALADLIEGRPAPLLVQQRNCPGPAALWGLLADPAATGPVARDDVIQSFQALPTHLRDLLGPRLVDAFLARGDENAARMVRDSALRAKAVPDPGLTLMEARTRPPSPDDLRRVLVANTPESPEALLLLIQGRLDRGEPVETALADMAAGMAREYRRTPLGPRLARAHALSLASAGLFDEAFGLAQGQGDLTGALLAMVTGTAPDTVFLRYALAADPAGAELAGLRRAMAERLLSLGFPVEARALLRFTPAEEGEDRNLMARAALASSDPAGALSALAGLPGPEAETIRSEAFLRLGDPGKAADAAARAQQSEEHRAALAWRIGDWAAVQANGTEAQKAVLAALPKAPEQVDEGRPLARNRARLEESRLMREALENLLTNGASLTESQELPG